MTTTELVITEVAPVDDATQVQEVIDATEPNVIALSEFVNTFGPALLEAVGEQNPPIYSGVFDPCRSAVLDALSRKAFDAQKHKIQAGASLLLDHNQRAYVLNGEMGTGKTMMAIALAAVLHAEGYQRALVVCPPHLVYKWRREIKTTIPNAVVWILNGPDTLRKLLQLRSMHEKPLVPTFFIMGRVRMRMGFNWVPAFWTRKQYLKQDDGVAAIQVAACPRCGLEITSEDPDGTPQPLSPIEAREYLTRRQMKCVRCGEALWMLKRDGVKSKSPDEVMAEALTQLPTVGTKTAERLIKLFGSNRLGAMLEDNVFEFINLMDANGDFIFSDRQARRFERAMSNTEFSFGTGGYQPSEFIKRYLPRGFFGVLIGDEGHEFKNDGSAQGQAFGVLSSQCRKAILLTGTLMGGYADDLFYLLWRLNPGMMIEDGFTAHRGSLGSAGMSFMREHGVIKDIYRESGGSESERSHRTAKGKTKVSHHVAKAPGFGPLGIMRFVLPITGFLKLRDIGGNALPPYVERFVGIPMTEDQEAAYTNMAVRLKQELSNALRLGDKTLMGVVLNALLAWPDCAFRSELVYHPRTRALLASAPIIFGEMVPSPKEHELIEICKAERLRGRKVLVYSCYTGTRDTTSRLKMLLEAEGFKTAVLRSSVQAAKREDWLMEKVDQGVEVIITNPELVKTGLDMLEFPTIVFMQCSYNVYTVMQAARRSWRIGQLVDVIVYFLGYLKTAQMQCFELVGKKIAVSQSTSGDMPDSGLDVLNDSGDSIEVALAKQLLA